jgi:hypothetical protein
MNVMKIAAITAIIAKKTIVMTFERILDMERG